MTSDFQKQFPSIKLKKKFGEKPNVSKDDPIKISQQNLRNMQALQKMGSVNRHNPKLQNKLVFKSVLVKSNEPRQQTVRDYNQAIFKTLNDSGLDKILHGDELAIANNKIYQEALNYGIKQKGQKSGTNYVYNKYVNGENSKKHLHNLAKQVQSQMHPFVLDQIKALKNHPLPKDLDIVDLKKLQSDLSELQNDLTKLANEKEKKSDSTKKTVAQTDKKEKPTVQTASNKEEKQSIKPTVLDKQESDKLNDMVKQGVQYGVKKNNQIYAVTKDGMDEIAKESDDSETKSWAENMKHDLSNKVKGLKKFGLKLSNAFHASVDAFTKVMTEATVDLKQLPKPKEAVKEKSTSEIKRISVPHVTEDEDKPEFNMSY